MAHRSELEILESQLINVNIDSESPLNTPARVKGELPLTLDAAETVLQSRKDLTSIIRGDDNRLVVVTGPCSIHNYDAAIEFGGHLRELSGEVGDKMLLVMRTYFEKPRTVGGWGGLIRDPQIDGTNDKNTGYREARKLLLDLAEMGVPTMSEIVHIGSTPAYLDGLLGGTCLGARTSESDYHRMVASGLSMPVGVKNSTSGDIQVAVNGVKRIGLPSDVAGMNEDGKLVTLVTKGNQDGYVILRGGNGSPNYHPGAVSKTLGMLGDAGLPPYLMIDCSHANSGKDHNRQPAVWSDVIDQRAAGNKGIVGVMLEANHKEGRNTQFKYGVDDPSGLDPYLSITDACISKETNARLIREAYRKL